MNRLRIVEYSDALAGCFQDINVQWIEAMFALEPHDREVLSHPREHIIDRGGKILFVEVERQGIVGAGALMPDKCGGIELTKMGVLEAARGTGAGRFLLSALIDRARGLASKRFYLMTNRRCEAAIHLYEQAGFQHDAHIMRLYGATYARCDVAMSYDFSRRD